MEFALMLRALTRHKAIVAVLILEFAVTLAILSNALSLATARIKVLHTPSGIHEAGLFIASPRPVGSVMSRLDGPAYDTLRNLLTSVPGVQAVSIIGQAPLTGGERWSGIVSLVPGLAGHPTDVAIYTGDQWMPATLGMSLAAGRWFAPQEVLPAGSTPDVSQVHLVLLTQSLASRLFKGKAAVGNTVYFDGQQSTVVGVLKSLSRPGYHGGTVDQDSVVVPAKPALFMGPQVAIRMKDNWQGSAQSLSKTLRDALDHRTTGSAVWGVESYQATRDRVFTADRAALGLLAAILVAVTGVAANGIAASSGYWVHQRARQTWIRRAIGATRHAVIAYFMAENAMICALGVALGIGLGLAVNMALIEYLNLTRMSVGSLIVGAILALLIGQFAVLRSAIKSVAA